MGRTFVLVVRASGPDASMVQFKNCLLKITKLPQSLKLLRFVTNRRPSCLMKGHMPTAYDNDTILFSNLFYGIDNRLQVLHPIILDIRLSLLLWSWNVIVSAWEHRFQKLSAIVKIQITSAVSRFQSHAPACCICVPHIYATLTRHIWTP